MLISVISICQRFPCYPHQAAYFLLIASYCLLLAAFCLHKNQTRGEDTNRTRPHWQPPHSFIVVWHGADIYTRAQKWLLEIAYGLHPPQTIFSTTPVELQYVNAYG